MVEMKKVAEAGSVVVSGDKDQVKECSVWARLTSTSGRRVWETAWAPIAAAKIFMGGGRRLKFWAPVSVAIGVLLAAIFLAYYPFYLIEYFLDLPPLPAECMLPRPVPDLNAWPADPASQLLNSSLRFNTEIPGPESLAWDAEGRIYTGVADGRVIRWNATDERWETFAVVSPLWSNELCDFKLRGKEYPALEHVCGRPLGLKFAASGSLYIADAYFGLAVVGSEGGLATILCSQSEGKVHQFTNDLDIDDEAGVVYFTVSSLRNQRKWCNRVVQECDRTGRVLKYELQTRKTTILLKDFQYPNGIALTGDRSSLLIVSTSSNKIRRYWLKGPKAREFELFAELPGYGDNIRGTEDKRFFWVALHGRRTALHYFLCRNPRVGRLLIVLQRMSKRLDKLVAGPVTPMVIKYNLHGQAVQVLEDRTGKSQANFISTAQERLGVLWLSSIYLPSIWVHSLA